jgi:aldose 1-epimerase
MSAPSEPTQSAEPIMASLPATPGHVPTPLTGRQFTISAGDYRASFTELGGGLRELFYRGRPLVTGYQPDELPPAGAGQLLAPWPNRIDGGRYEFGGTSYQLELSEAARGNAIHGLTRWANWEPAPELAAQSGQQAAADLSGDRITLGHLLHGRTGYPFCIQLAVSYRLEASSGLHVTVSAWNVGSRPAPYGTGCHPYLTTGEPAVDGCELQVEATHWLATDDRGIPSGPPQDVAGTPFDFGAPRLIGDTQLDHALTGLRRDEAGLAWAQLTGGHVKLGLWAGPGYDWLQVFTGDALAPPLRRRALAIEPMTCPANAFVSGDGLLTLAPGDSVTHTWGIAVLQP